MKSRVFALILVLVCCVAIAPLHAPAASLPHIVEPRYSAPYAELAGSTFNVTFSGPIEVKGVWLVAPGLNYSLSVVKTYTLSGAYKVLVKIPRDVKPSLYDVYVKTGSAVIREPRAVWVVDKYSSSITFVHLTDIHIGITIGGRPSYYSYETAINLLNSLPVDFAVITGDDVDVGSDIKSLQLFRLITNLARKPTFIVPGNHDHAQTDEKSFAERYYGLYIGKACWYRVIGKFLLVGLDTGAEGYLSPNQLTWLESVLSRYRDKVKILLMHHPIFNYGVFGKIEGSLDQIRTKMYSSWAHHLDSAKEFLRIIDKYNVVAVLAGHVHGDSVVLLNGKTWFITTTTTCGGVRPGDYRGFRIITVKADGTVKIWSPSGKNPLKEFASYNIDKVTLRYVKLTWTDSCALLAKVQPDFGLDISKLTAYFYLTPVDRKYSGFGGVKVEESLKYGDLLVVRGTLQVKPGVEQYFAVAAEKDEEPPTVSIVYYSPRKPLLGKDTITFYISADDKGWGVVHVYLAYVTPSGVEMKIPAVPSGGDTYTADLPPLRTSSVKVWVEAVDAAGNAARTPVLVINYTVPQTQTQTPQTKPQKPKPTTQPSKPAPQQNVTVTINVPSIKVQRTLTPLPLIVAAAAAACAAIVVVFIVLKRRGK